MSRVYDNWERLVGAVLDREELRQLRSVKASAAPVLLRLQLISVSVSMPMLFEDLKKATKNFRFDFHLGEGGFGTVYKGWLNEHTLTAAKPGTGLAVAVKKWEPAIMGSRELLKELTYLNQLRHPNLVKLIAYCFEDNNVLSVYELMSKGSLENHLFKRGNLSLPWATRIKVSKGAARGLSFLHHLEIPVIYRYFKTCNILRDGEFNAKLCGLGMARDGPTGDMTHVSTQVIGTHGYAAPEYVMTGHLTVKCDVFSFGVVLLEFLTGRRAIDRTKVSKEQDLVEWAKPCLNDKRKLFQIMDPKLEGKYPEHEACTIAALALQCLNVLPKLRPSMAEVVIALDQL